MKNEDKWYKSVSNILFIIACSVLGIMLIVNLSIMYQAKKDENVVPSVFGFKPFMVLSGSMESTIHKGDLIFTKIINPETLKINDVIAFRDAAGTITTHRIIDMVDESGETYFITKGDNNNSQDKNLVSLDDVEGLYVGRIPGIGSIMSSLSEPTTIVILVLGITAIFVISFTISNKKQQDLERKEFLEYKRAREKEEFRKENDSYEEFWEYKQSKERHDESDKQFEDKKDDFWGYNEDKNSKNNVNYYDENQDDDWNYNKIKKQQEFVESKENFDDFEKNNNRKFKENNSRQNQSNSQEKSFEYKNYNKQQNYKQNRNYNNQGYNDKKNYQSNQKQYGNNRDNSNYNKSNNKNYYNNPRYNKTRNYSSNNNNQKNNRNYNSEYRKNNGQYNKESQQNKEWQEFLEYKRMKEQQGNSSKND